MTEIEQMMRALGTPEDMPIALATVVNVEGSAYRRPGARMLIYADGRRIGSVSGGCLEADVVERARSVSDTSGPAYVVYDTRIVDGELAYDLGCRGAVGILIESTADARVTECLAQIAALSEQREFGALATVYTATGDAPHRVGDRVVTGVRSTVRHFAAQQAGRSAASARLQSVLDRGLPAAARTVNIASATGSCRAFVEPLAPPIQLVLCGAGEDARPLAAVAAMLGWSVAICDHRPAMLAAGRFPEHSKLLHTSNAQPPDSVDDRTAIVVMTHSYSHDLAWLRSFAGSPARYIGLLGPRRRSEQLLAELREESGAVSAAMSQILHSPTGLDIGAETPAEIAVAVVAEIRAEFAGRGGGMLRDRAAPIHDPFASNSVSPADVFVRPPCPISQP